MKRKLAECESAPATATTSSAGAGGSVPSHASITITVYRDFPGDGDAVNTKTEYMTFVGENAADAAIAYLQSQTVVPATPPSTAAQRGDVVAFSVPRDEGANGTLWLEAKKEHLRQLGAFMLAEHAEKKDPIFRTMGRALLSLGRANGLSNVKELSSLWESARAGTKFANVDLPVFVAECSRTMRKINEMMDARMNVPHFGHFKNPNRRKVNHRRLGPMAGDNPLPPEGKEKTATTEKPKAAVKKIARPKKTTE